MTRGGARAAVLLALALVTGCSNQGSDARGSAADPVAPVEYSLGDATVVQQAFDADSRFRTMPVRVNGLIAVPAEGDGPDVP